MISFSCPQCAKGLKVKDELAGKKAKCPSCGQSVPVPATAPVVPGQSRPQPEGAGNEPGARRPGGPLVPTYSSSDSEGLTEVPGTVPHHECDFLAPARGPNEIGWLGPYRVLEVLGSGGMGVVFKAEDPALKRIIVLKAMKPALAASASAGKRFLLEAQATAKIKHDNIVIIYQVGEDHGVPFIAMELLEGESLHDRVSREGKLPTAEVLRIGKEIARGLAAAHKHDLMHRDIKPANIWLEAETRRVKILDFGLARAGRQQSTLTQPGAILGTPAYMAPEQAGDGTIDHRCDLFSLGCVLYELCTGNRAFQGQDAISTLMAVATVYPPAPRLLSKQVPTGLSDLVMKLLEKKPADRPQTAQAVVDILTELEADPTEQLPAERVAESRKRPAAAEIVPSGPASQGTKKASRPAEARAKPQADKGKSRAWIPLLLLLLGGAVAAGGVYVALNWADWNRNENKDGEVVDGKDGTREPADKESEAFFNGKDRVGWEGLDRYWTVKDGAIVGSSMPEGVEFNTFLCSKKKYRDFDIKFQVRLRGGIKANSGMQFRSRISNRERFIVLGPQVDMGEGYWGDLFHEGGKGPTQLAPTEKVNRVLRKDEFNDFHVRCTGKHVLIEVNGVTTVDDEFADLPPDGIIAWQIHRGEKLEVTIRNIEFRELQDEVAQKAEKVLFDGKNLSGWVSRKTGGPATWKVVDGYAETGPVGDDIYTKEKFGPHFQLHAEFYVTRSGPVCNSGIYLQGRYEIQIVDSHKRFNPTESDCGALYGLIAPSTNEACKPPGQWQTLDITFRAPHPDAKNPMRRKGKLTVVLNGTKVIDDKQFERPTAMALDSNIDQPGPIMLQAHGGVVRFRNIRLNELRTARAGATP
jgi:serine/threonine protein kinase